MTNEPRSIDRFRLKSLISILLVFVGGLSLLLWSQNIQSDPNTHNSPFLKLFLEHLATALLAGALVSFLYEYLLRKEFLDTSAESRALTIEHHEKILTVFQELRRDGSQAAESFRETLAASKEQAQLGISHCCLKVDSFNFGRLFEESRNLTIVMNDGRGVVSNYYQRFANRFQRPDAQTTIILMRPNSPAIDLHAAKVGTTPDGIRIKIAETIKLLKRANSGRTGLKILGHDMYNTMSLFLTEKEAIVTPYFLTKVRRTPPVFSFIDVGDNCLYREFSQDVAALLLDCTDISSYDSEDGRKPEDSSYELAE